MDSVCFWHADASGLKPSTFGGKMCFMVKLKSIRIVPKEIIMNLYPPMENKAEPINGPKHRPIPVTASM